MNNQQLVIKEIEKLVKLLEAREGLLNELCFPLLDNADIINIAKRLSVVLTLIKETIGNQLHLVEMAEIYRKEQNTIKRLQKLNELREENEFYMTQNESVFLNVLIEIMEQMVLRAAMSNTSTFQPVVQKPPKSIAQKITEGRLSTKINNNTKKVSK